MNDTDKADLDKLIIAIKALFENGFRNGLSVRDGAEIFFGYKFTIKALGDRPKVKEKE